MKAMRATGERGRSDAGLRGPRERRLLVGVQGAPTIKQ